MGADYSFYVKTIEPHARAFLALNILAIGRVVEIISLHSALLATKISELQLHYICHEILKPRYFDFIRLCLKCKDECRSKIHKRPNQFLASLKDALAALGLPFNGGKIAGRASLKAALYPPQVGIVGTGAVSQPNPSSLPSSQPSGASGSAKYVSASQPNQSHVAPIQPCPAPPDQVAVGNNIQAEGREQWHLLTQTNGPVYTRIPVASQNKASHVFSTLLNKAYKDNNETAWKKVFNFAMCGLGSSKRGGTKHTSQATLINERLDAFVSGSVVAKPPPKKTTKAKSSKPSEPMFASRVSAKLAMGDLRGAVTVVTSREAILPPSQETKELLIAKNPPRKRSENTRAPIPDFNGNLSHFWVSKEDIRSGIRSFKKGASGGPDGLRPQHLLRGAIWGKTGKT
jgi:hypothetical protein